MDGETLAIFLGMFVTAIVMLAFTMVFAKLAKASRDKQRMERYKQKQAQEAAKAARESTGVDSTAAQRQKTVEMRQIASAFGLLNDDDEDDEEDEMAKKHKKHLEDIEEHGHTGREEHYEEIVGSLGEVNDEGCADLSGVRFLADDIAYDLQEQDKVDYNRIAQAMVLGEIVNTPRFKSPYSRHK